MSGLSVVWVMLFWTNVALKGPKFAKGLSRCSQPSHHGHPVYLSCGVNHCMIDTYSRFLCPTQQPDQV